MARAKPKIEAFDADGFALVADPAVLQQPANHLDRFPDVRQRLALRHAVLGLWLDQTPRINRPPVKSSSVAAAMAIVGAVRTKTLVMLVPRKMREVWLAAAASTTN